MTNNTNITEEQQLRMEMATEMISRFPIFAKGKDAIDDYYQEHFKRFTDTDLKLFVPSMIHFNTMSFDFIRDPIIRGKVKHIADMDIERFQKEMKRRGLEQIENAIVHLSAQQAAKENVVTTPEAIQILNRQTTKH